MKKGILLPIFSLPSKYGIGDFGAEAYEFIDILADNGIDYWEILPINAGDDCPYSPRSYYALNERYISLDKLIEMGLIKSEILEVPYKNRIVYKNLNKEKYYIEAYSNYVKDEVFEEFKNNKELLAYANYMSNRTGLEVDYYMFLQYILLIQWNELKKYAHSKKVYIIGDMPIYPDLESSEVMINSKYYQVTPLKKALFVSGAAPDCFSDSGQKWGHPLYNFKEIAKDNYKYLIDRYLYYLNMFDLIRIDHFKAFESYYKIPFDKSPKYGFYEPGPSYDFFDELFKYTSSDRFITEDLGDITKETIELRDKYNFKGMKIIQYTLKPNEMKDEYPDKKNMVIYTGNHDNNTIMGWYNSLTVEEQNNLREFLDFKGCSDDLINYSFIKYCLNSVADLVIIPVQDVIGLGEEGRINLPGCSSDDNWSWHLKDFSEFREKIKIMTK